MLVGMLCCCVTATAQTRIQPSYANTDWGAYISSMVAVDVNNDGWRDLIWGGVGPYETYPGGEQVWERQRSAHVALYANRRKTWSLLGHANFEAPDEGLGFDVADRPSLSVCDINQDGYMDLIAFESVGRFHTDLPFADHLSREGIFLGNGNGSFTEFVPTFCDADGQPVHFRMEWVLSADVADMNNDGRMDIVCIGCHNDGGDIRTYPEANVVLFNEGGGRFRVSHYLTDDYTVSDYGQDGKTYHLVLGQVNAFDMNNDGYVDFFVTAESQDREVLGVTNGSNTHFTELFLNDPAHPGQFRRQQIGDRRVWDNPLPQLSEGGLAIADMNGDRTPDVFLSGWSGNGRGSYIWRVYLNTINDDGRVRLSVNGHAGLSEMRNQNTTNTQYVPFDWNGDGIVDIFNSGWSTSLSTQTCLLGIGKGDGTFSEQLRLSGGSEGATVLLDWNGDSVPDYVTIGQTGDMAMNPSLSSFGSIFSVTYNPNPKPQCPQEPTVGHELLDNGQVRLMWSDASDIVGSLTHEYYVMDADGRIVAGGNAFTTERRNGLRKVNAPGNAYYAPSVILSLPDGTYTYGVQTVDASYQGSTFATGTFTISGSPISPAVAWVNPGRETPSTSTTYTNPIINRSMPDPTIIRADDGFFYVFATEDVHNTPIYRSRDLITWQFVGTAFTDATRPTMVPGGGIWAPDINYIGGQYVLYYTKSTWGGEWECGIGAATASKPEGPYTDHGPLFISSEIGVQNSIDQFYIEDEDDGRKYLFWGSFRGIYGIELSDDGLSIRPGAEKFQIAGTRTEGTYIIRHDGYYYLIGSGGGCCDGVNSTYHLLMARSKNLRGPYVDRFGRSAMSGFMSNFLYRSQAVAGPGHNSEFVQDDTGQYWMFYHGVSRSDPTGRKLYLDPVDWDEDGWPMIRNLRPSVRAPRPVFGTNPTGVDEVQSTRYKVQGDGAVYDLQGRRVSIPSLTGRGRGGSLYIIDGQKVLVR